MISEKQIVDRVERLRGHLDRLLALNSIDRKTYDLAVKDLVTWAAAARQESTTREN
jgi:hypothetical protein